MSRGTLKWFNHVSDYGFIAGDDGGPDRYVRGENVSGLLAAFPAGSRVEYEPRQGGMGPEAINVRLEAATTVQEPEPEPEEGTVASSGGRVP